MRALSGTSLDHHVCQPGYPEGSAGLRARLLSPGSFPWGTVKKDNEGVGIGEDL